MGPLLFHESRRPWVGQDLKAGKPSTTTKLAKAELVLLGVSNLCPRIQLRLGTEAQLRYHLGIRTLRFATLAAYTRHSFRGWVLKDEAYREQQPFKREGETWRASMV